MVAEGKDAGAFHYHLNFQPGIKDEATVIYWL